MVCHFWAANDVRSAVDHDPSSHASCRIAGAGDFLSSKAEFEFLLTEKERSGKMVKDGRTQEVVDTLVKKGAYGTICV